MSIFLLSLLLAPMFRGDPQHHGLAAGEGPHGNIHIVWRAQTGGPVRSSPAVDGDAVFVGSEDGFLYAFDRIKGTRLWRFRTGAPVYGSPAVGGNSVYITGFDGQLHALARATGKERWHVATGAERIARFGFDTFASSPVIEEETLYTGGADHRVRAVDASNGHILWTSPDLGDVIRSTPAITNDRVVVGTYAGAVVALDRKTGAKVWTFATMGAGLNSEDFGYDRQSIVASPAIAGDRVIIGGRDGVLYGVGLADGKELWRFDHKIFWVVASAAIDGDSALVGNSDGHYFQSFEVATGKLQWTFKTGDRVFSSATIAAQSAYFGCGSGALFAVDAKSGRELWRFWIGTPIDSSPAISDGVLYVGADDGALYAIAGQGPDRGPVERVVYAPEERSVRFKDGVMVRDEAQRAGYEILDAPKLAAFLEARTNDRKPSVVIFANDRVSQGALLRKYLETGGRVVWLGAPPDILVIDPETGKPKGVDMKRAEAVTGVSFEHMAIDDLTIRPTAAAQPLDLADWWIGTGSVDAAGIDTVYATDDYGRPVVWRKRVGAGSFVMIDASEHLRMPLKDMIRLAEAN